jgi:hypothetical protein
VILVPVPAQQTDHLRPESTSHRRTLEGTCVKEIVPLFSKLK